MPLSGDESGSDPAAPAPKNFAGGYVWLVGAGPGDPRLITVRGAELLGECDVVLHDALSHPALLDLCPQAEVFNVGKRFGRVSPSQASINANLVELARAGRRVVRLKGGDPLMFARGAEEALALVEAGIPFEIVPGISSPVAASAYAGISLTHRDVSSSVTFITGSDRDGKEWSPEQWKKLATATGTICVLMGMRRIEAITDALIDGGRDPATPVAVIQWGARPAQRVVTAPLSKVAAEVRRLGVSNPAVILVGEVAELRREMAWFEKLPLFGQRVLVPRPAHQAQSTAEAIRRLGAEPLCIPALDVVDPPDPAPLREAVERIASYDWVVFTSANGVQRFFAELRAQGRDSRALGGARLAAIGPKTAAALRPQGLVADVVAEDFVAESLIEALLARGTLGRVLVPRARVAREVLPEALRAQGAEVDVVPAYETRPVEGEGRARLVGAIESEVDVVLFTSSSMVDSVVEALGNSVAELLRHRTIACIGPITARTARERGIDVDVEAEVHTVDGILTALGRFLSSPRRD